MWSDFARTELRRLSETAITYSIGFWSVAHPTGPKQWDAILESSSPGLRNGNGTAKKPLTQSLELGEIQRSFVPAKPRNHLG